MEIHISLTFIVEWQQLYELTVHYSEASFVGGREPVGQYDFTILGESHEAAVKEFVV